MVFIVILVFLPLLVRGLKISTDEVGDEQPLVVICPPLRNGNDTVQLPKYSNNIIRYVTSTDYCTCMLSAVGNGKTVIIKCDFEFEKDIILDDNLFPFKQYNIGSAYVRMTNSKSAKITSKFLSTWMDSPSSALDIWHCGKLTLESTPIPTELQLYSGFKTFVGVGIIDCVVEELPSQFLRDRNRGAIRIKDSQIGKISAGFLHNVEEMRYVIMEDSVIDEIASPISSSGAISLSKRRIHSWDGMEISSTTIHYIQQNALNITHMEEMEKLTIQNCNFGNLEQGGLTVFGDINVAIDNNSFSNLDSLAIKVSVTGSLSFTNNKIENTQVTSLLGLICGNQSLSLANNTINVATSEGVTNTAQYIPFSTECGDPHVNIIKKMDTSQFISPKKSDINQFTSSISPEKIDIVENTSMKLETSNTPVIVGVTLTLAALLIVISFLMFSNRIKFQQYLYRMRDTPLWNEDN